MKRTILWPVGSLGAAIAAGVIYSIPDGAAPPPSPKARMVLVNLNDMIACWTGPGTAAAPSCNLFQFECDHCTMSVDLRDWAGMERWLSRRYADMIHPNSPIGTGCGHRCAVIGCPSKGHMFRRGGIMFCNKHYLELNRKKSVATRADMRPITRRRASGKLDIV